MAPLNTTQTWLDRAIGYVNPERAARRMAARAQMAMAGDLSRGKRKGEDRFAIPFGKSTSLRGGSYSSRRVRDENRDRARNAFENNVIAKSLLTTETDYVVAEGFNFQPRSNNPAWNKEAEQRYYAWLEQADVTGQRTGTELVRTTWLNSRMDGDGALLRAIVNGYPRLQYLPGDLLESPIGDVASRTMYDGVQTDESMRPAYYHFAIRDRLGTVIDRPVVAAANISYLSHVSHPLDLRGTSVLSTIFDTLDQIDNYRDSVTKAAIMACVFGLIHKVNNPGTTVAGFGVQPNAGGVDQKAISLENGMLRVEGTAESTYQVNASQPMTQTPDFIRALFRIACLAFDMPIEIGSKDLSQVNFSGGRIGLLGFYRASRIKADWLLSRCWRPTTDWWLDVERERQRLGFADAFKTPFPDDYRNYDLTGREYESNDRLSEAQADLLEISMGKRSLQQIMNAAGIEYASTMAQNKAHVEWCVRNNVPIVLSSSSRDWEPGTPATDGASPIENVRAVVDAFGVGVRAGGLTPQVSDEEKLRTALNLPPMSDAARQAWEDEGGVRKPITLVKPEDAATALPVQPN